MGEPGKENGMDEDKEIKKAEESPARPKEGADNPIVLGMGVGIVAGAALGFLIGMLFFKNYLRKVMTYGMAFGMCAGMALGAFKKHRGDQK
jgi:high-affinity Fe2+/Pb2+ permease